MKKQARRLLSKNYKLFLFPTILCIFSAFMLTVSLYAFFSDVNLFCKTLSLCVFLVFQLIVLPISKFLLYKTSVRVVNDDIEKSKMFSRNTSFKDLVMIAFIWLVPNVLDIVSEMLDGVKEYWQLPSNITLSILLTDLIVLVFLEYLAYKYFACDYYYSLNKGTIKDTLRFSFGIMKGRFFEQLLLTLSFFHLYLIGAILTGAICSLIITKLLDEIIFIKFAIFSIGGGIYFYLVPYEYITRTLYIKEISEK